VSDILSLLKVQVDVYHFDLTSQNESKKADSKLLLDESELLRAKQFKFDFLQERFIQAHGQLRQIFIHLLGVNPIIDKTSEGKPYLKDFPGVEFNLSHSENKAVCAITLNTPLGVDIEYSKPERKMDIFSIAERFFSSQDIESLRSAKDPMPLFFMIWTRKEASIKCKGAKLLEGLSLEIPQNIEVHDFTLEDGYTGALAIEKCSKKILLKSWN
jgi:4'-phosphopantetheinyl transferase